MCTCGWHPKDYLPSKNPLDEYDNSNDDSNNDSNDNSNDDSNDDCVKDLEKHKCGINCGLRCTCGFHSDPNSSKSFGCNNPTTKIKDAVNKLNESFVHKKEELIWTRIANEVKEILDQIKLEN